MLHDLDLQTFLPETHQPFAHRRILSILRGQNVLVTGAGGAVGAELCRQILQYEPHCLVACESDQIKLRQLQENLSRLYPKLGVKYVAGDDRKHLRYAVELNEITHFYHCDEYQHVLLTEFDAAKCVIKNLDNTVRAVSIAIAAGVKKFCIVTTSDAEQHEIDTLSKRAAEIIGRLSSDSQTQISAVRLNNVLTLSHCCIAKMLAQIALRCVTLPSENASQRFVSLPDACELALVASLPTNSVGLYSVNPWQALMLRDVARTLIEVQGLKPGSDVELRFTGALPSADCPTPGLEMRRESALPWSEINALVNRAIVTAKQGNILSMKKSLRQLGAEAGISVAV